MKEFINKLIKEREQYIKERLNNGYELDYDKGYMHALKTVLNYMNIEEDK